MHWNTWISESLDSVWIPKARGTLKGGGRERRQKWGMYPHPPPPRPSPALLTAMHWSNRGCLPPTRSHSFGSVTPFLQLLPPLDSSNNSLSPCAFASRAGKSSSLSLTQVASPSLVSLHFSATSLLLKVFSGPFDGVYFLPGPWLLQQQRQDSNPGSPVLESVLHLYPPCNMASSLS